MPKKKNTNSNSFRFIDGLVITACLAGALACLFLFWLDLTNTLSRLGEQPVGTITWKYKAAQRRFIDRVLWDRLQMESPVYNGDLIRTAFLSEASITFLNGGVVDLAENSLIRIFANDAFPRIDLMDGAFNAAAGEGGMIVNAGEHELTLDSGGTVTGGGTEFQITGGRGVLRSGGSSRELGAGEALRFGSGGTEAAAVVTSPLPNTRILISGTSAAAVDFIWNRQNYGAAGRTRIDVARDRNFTRSAAALDLAGGESRARVELPPGVYYWRVYAVQNAGPAAPPASRYFKLTILNMSPPKLISPAAEESAVYYPGSRPLRFRWTAPAGEGNAGYSAPPQEGESPDYYLLEAADNPAMANPALRMQIRGTRAETPLPGPGRWYWRVSAHYGTVPLVSAVTSFTLRQGGDLAPPDLVSPAAAGEVDIGPGARNVYFSWGIARGAASYTLLISPNRDLSSPLITRMALENYYAYPVSSGILTEGQYYWGVSPVDNGGRGFSFSPSRLFTAREAPPVLTAIFPPDNYTVAESLLPDIRFTWRSSLSPLRFQVSGNADFTDPVMDTPAEGGAFQGRRLSAGTWYWRILADTAAPGESPVSSPGRRLVVAGALPPPVLAVMDGQISVSPGKPVEFRWRPVEGADYYQFRLYNAGGILLYTEETAAASTALAMDGYPEGNYRWTVQALTRESDRSSRRNGIAGTALFYLVNPPEPVPLLAAAQPDVQTPPEPSPGVTAAAFDPAAPKLVVPADNLVFGAVQLREAGSIVFNWEEMEGASTYTFTLFDEAGRQILRDTVSEASYVLSDLRVLSRGAFIWRVQANPSFDNEKGASSQRRFVIDIPPVNRPQLHDMGILYGNE